MARAWIAGLVSWIAACSTAGAPQAETDAAPAEGASSHPADAAPSVPAFGPEIISLRLRRSIVVRLHPKADAKPIGTVAADTHVSWRRWAPGTDHDCARWIEIDPRGWVCDRYLQPTGKPPYAVELPKLKPNELLPGVYGKVVGKGARAYRNAAAVLAGRPGRMLAGSVTVRREQELRAGGRRFWKTSSGELIEASKISVHEPSALEGVRLDADGAPTPPFAWVQGRKRLAEPVEVRSLPDPKAPLARKLPQRAIVSVLDATPDGSWIRIGDGEWVTASDMHVARVTQPPAGLLGVERWLDVDLDEQVLVAYEGTMPVYATMVSTGNPRWPTAPGIYRIWIKFAETDMNGQMGDEQPYSVATVPWTMFFAKDLAFHTAYWHDRFGEPRSHGCVNLSPKDARALYFWATPDVPPGWSMAHGVVEMPGSMVRIRSKEVPQPEFQGYAKRVFEARVAAGLVAAPIAPIPPSETDAGSEDAGSRDALPIP
ncbi:MAG: L,D-transpeptidase [Deltaproteobacteria bacterium]|nr:L,D-transpeptidase [Deltaproteobacteria bacterium]